MVRLLIILTLGFLLVMLVRQLRKYFRRDKKEKELQDTFIEGDLADIELEIAEEKARQEEVRKATCELKSENNSTEKEKNNE
jgi:hypothetical protein